MEVSRHDRNFVTCYNGTDQTFGILSGYPCCTSNLHQGWPKFVRNLWFATPDKGLAALYYSPSTVSATVGDGTKITLSEETNYPFDGNISFKININGKNNKSVDFPLHLRIPGWCKEGIITVNGKPFSKSPAGSIAQVKRTWKSGDIVKLMLPMDISSSRWYEGSAVVERGPLVYALRIEEDWHKVNDDRKFGDRYGDWYYEVFPKSPWNYCLIEDHLKDKNIRDCFKIVEKPMRDYPWNLENAPIEIHAKGKRMNEWSLYNGSAGPQPYSTQYQIETMSEENIVLIPYGCTTLRITEFPVTRK